MIALARDDDARLLDAYSRAVVDVVERAGPAVVAIEIGAARGSHPGDGSGFVVTPDGYVMTNSHVVSGARAIQVKTPAGETLEGRVVGGQIVRLTVIRRGGRLTVDIVPAWAGPAA